MTLVNGEWEREQNEFRKEGDRNVRRRRTDGNRSVNLEMEKNKRDDEDNWIKKEG